MTSSASRSITSSPGSADGPSQLDLLDGLMPVPSGPPPARASRSRARAKDSEPMIQGICGRTYFACGEPSGPLSAWENRLRKRLAMVGSTECALVWREKATPAGQSIFRLSRSTRHTNGTGSIGSPWPTPKAATAGPDFAKLDRSLTGISLQTAMALVDRAEEVGVSAPSSPEVCPPSAVTASPWSTPRSSDGEKGAPNQCFSGGGQPLPAQMYAASPWVTPATRDHKGSRTPEGSQDIRVGGQMLNEQMVETADMATWPTVTSLSFKDSHQPGNCSSMNKMMDLIVGPTAASGPTPTGSSATTVKRGGSPTPAHPCWLMGFEAAWLYLAPQNSARPRTQKKSTG